MVANSLFITGKLEEEHGSGPRKLEAAQRNGLEEPRNRDIHIEKVYKSFSGNTQIVGSVPTPRKSC